MNTKSSFVDIRVTWYRKSMRGAAAAATAAGDETVQKQKPPPGRGEP